MSTDTEQKPQQQFVLRCPEDNLCIEVAIVDWDLNNLVDVILGEEEVRIVPEEKSEHGEAVRGRTAKEGQVSMKLSTGKLLFAKKDHVQKGQIFKLLCDDEERDTEKILELAEDIAVPLYSEEDVETGNGTGAKGLQPPKAGQEVYYRDEEQWCSPAHVKAIELESWYHQVEVTLDEEDTPDGEPKKTFTIRTFEPGSKEPMLEKVKQNRIEIDLLVDGKGSKWHAAIGGQRQIRNQDSRSCCTKHVIEVIGLYCFIPELHHLSEYHQLNGFNLSILASLANASLDEDEDKSKRGAIRTFFAILNQKKRPMHANDSAGHVVVRLVPYSQRFNLTLLQQVIAEHSLSKVFFATNPTKLIIGVGGISRDARQAGNAHQEMQAYRDAEYRWFNPDDSWGNRIGGFIAKVHGGHWVAHTSIKDELIDYVDQYGQGKDIYITGHGAGGVLAQILAYKLASSGLATPVVYTYGTPFMIQSGIYHQSSYKLKSPKANYRHVDTEDPLAFWCSYFEEPTFEGWVERNMPWLGLLTAEGTLTAINARLKKLFKRWPVVLGQAIAKGTAHIYTAIGIITALADAFEKNGYKRYTTNDAKTVYFTKKFYSPMPFWSDCIKWVETGEDIQQDFEAVGFDFVAFALVAGNAAKPFYLTPHVRILSDTVKSLEKEKNYAWYSSIDVESVEKASHVPSHYIGRTQANAAMQLSVLPTVVGSQASTYLYNYSKLLAVLYERACTVKSSILGDGLIEVTMLSKEKERAAADLATLGKMAHMELPFKQEKQLVKKQLQQPGLFR